MSQPINWVPAYIVRGIVVIVLAILAPVASCQAVGTVSKNETNRDQMKVCIQNGGEWAASPSNRDPGCYRNGVRDGIRAER